jgi:hypothetical protein
LVFPNRSKSGGTHSRSTFTLLRLGWNLAGAAIDT